MTERPFRWPSVTYGPRREPKPPPVKPKPEGK